MEPVVEAPRIAQPRQAAPGPDERLLGGILGELRVAEDEVGRGVQARAGRADELGEGLPVPAPRSLQESLLVHGPFWAGGATAAAALGT
jgi:hypothetical protein